MISKITAIIMAIISILSNLTGIIPTEGAYYTDVSYGKEERQVLDVAFPENPEKEIGLVLYIHGGSWIKGDKSGFKGRVKETSRKIGCIAATMNYRFASKTVGFDEMLKDIEAALVKIKSMAEQKGLNCNRVILAGASAGAHLSMLYSYAKASSAPIKPCAVVSYSGPPDLRSNNFLTNIGSMSHSETYTLMSYLTKTNFFTISENDKIKALYKYSPTKYVKSSSVPTLIVHGTKDEIVPVNDARDFANKLNSLGVVNKYYELPDSGHGLSEDDYLLKKSDATFVDFVNLYLK